MEEMTTLAEIGFWERVSNVFPWLFIALVVLVFTGIVWWALDQFVFKSWNLGSELRKGNLAVAIFAAGIFIGLMIFASSALGAPTDRYDRPFKRASLEYFSTVYPWQIFKAQGMTESNLDPAVCSHVGACGLMQFMPGTALGMGLVDRFRARDSITYGVRYDRQLWGQWTARRTLIDRLRFAFMSYNAGLGNILKFQKRAVAAGLDPNSFSGLYVFIWKEPREYVKRIEWWCARFRGARC